MFGVLFNILCLLVSNLCVQVYIIVQDSSWEEEAFQKEVKQDMRTALSSVSHVSVSSLISAQYNQRLFITIEQIRQDCELCLIAMPSPPKVLGFSYLHNMLSNYKLATKLPHPHWPCSQAMFFN